MHSPLPDPALLLVSLSPAALRPLPLQFKGRGHEVGDLRRLLEMYRRWQVGLEGGVQGRGLVWREVGGHACTARTDGCGPRSCT